MSEREIFLRPKGRNTRVRENVMKSQNYSESTRSSFPRCPCQIHSCSHRCRAPELLTLQLLYILIIQYAMDSKESHTPSLRVSSESDYQDERDTFFNLKKETNTRRSRFVTIFLVLALICSNGAWLWHEKHPSRLSSQYQTQR